jgi:hypothetical protein
MRKTLSLDPIFIHRCADTTHAADSRGRTPGRGRRHADEACTP